MNNPDSKTPDGVVPNENSILSKVIETVGSLRARARARELIKEASFNEAIIVIERLEAEVTKIIMPRRFSRTAKPSESVYKIGILNPILEGLTEDEYKRQQLLINLGQIKQEIISAVSGLEGVILDIEATKQEG